jgi:hypothetical protein
MHGAEFSLEKSTKCFAKLGCLTQENRMPVHDGIPLLKLKLMVLAKSSWVKDHFPSPRVRNSCNHSGYGDAISWHRNVHLAIQYCISAVDVYIFVFLFISLNAYFCQTAVTKYTA